VNTVGRTLPIGANWWLVFNGSEPDEFVRVLRLEPNEYHRPFAHVPQTRQSRAMASRRAADEAGAMNSTTKSNPPRGGSVDLAARKFSKARSIAKRVASRSCILRVDLSTRQNWDMRKAFLSTITDRGQRRVRVVKLRMIFNALLSMRAYVSIQKRKQLAPPGIVNISQHQALVLDPKNPRVFGREFNRASLYRCTVAPAAR